MRIDWDAMQPADARFNLMATLMYRLVREMGNLTPQDAPKFVHVLQVNGFTSALAMAPRGFDLVTASGIEPINRTVDQHCMCMEYLFSRYIRISETLQYDLYYDWYRDATYDRPPSYEIVETKGWDEI